MNSGSPAPRLAVPETLDPDLLEGFDPQAQLIALEGATMGTVWRVNLALPSGLEADTVGESIQARLDDIVAQMSHWEPSSLLRGYNLSAPGSWVHLPGDFARVIAGSLEVAERSHGAFDPALGRLTDVWGLGPNPAPGIPSEGEIAEALQHSGWRHLAFDAELSRLRQPGGLWLDLSGVAKGYAADAVADLLAGRGIRHALVEIGGELVGRGIRPDSEPWWVDIETPPGFSVAPLRVALAQLAIATSGNYLRGAHTLDPATGRLPDNRTTAVSVLHRSCMMADAWASALGVLPSDQARQMAEREQLKVRLLSSDGNEWLSSAFARLL